MRTIEILGTACERCASLAKNAEAAARELAVPYELHRITDIEDIVEYGPMSLPALAIDGVLKIVGRVASVDEIKVLLRECSSRSGFPA